MGYSVVEHKDLFKTCHVEKNPFGLGVQIPAMETLTILI